MLVSRQSVPLRLTIRSKLSMEYSHESRRSAAILAVLNSFPSLSKPRLTVARLFEHALLRDSDIHGYLDLGLER